MNASAHEAAMGFHGFQPTLDFYSGGVTAFGLSDRRCLATAGRAASHGDRCWLMYRSRHLLPHGCRGIMWADKLDKVGRVSQDTAGGSGSLFISIVNILILS